MGRDEQIGRMILEAMTGLHGNMARDIAQAWCSMAEQKKNLLQHIAQLEKEKSSLENKRSLLSDTLGKCIIASGIVRKDVSLSGPELLLFGDDLENMLQELSNKLSSIETKN